MKRTFAYALAVTLALLPVGVASAAIQKNAPCTDGCTWTGPAGSDVLYSQLDDPSGWVFPDQQFEFVYAVYDCAGADDFDVDEAQGWDLTLLTTAGAAPNPGAVPLFVSHYFYEDGGENPGAVSEGCDFPANTSFVHDGGGIQADVSGCNLAAGVHWVSQQVRLDYTPWGQHFWATRASANGMPAVWRNPGNGFGTVCSDWLPANTFCGMMGQDFLFELSGVSRCCSDPVPAVGPLGTCLVALALGAASAFVLRRRRA